MHWDVFQKAFDVYHHGFCVSINLDNFATSWIIYGKTSNGKCYVMNVWLSAWKQRSYATQINVKQNTSYTRIENVNVKLRVEKVMLYMYTYCLNFINLLALKSISQLSWVWFSWVRLLGWVGLGWFGLRRRETCVTHLLDKLEILIKTNENEF